MKQRNIITGLDIGSNKICALVATVDATGRANLIASSLVKSEGVYNGSPRDINKVSDSILQALSEAGKKAQTEIHSVFANISDVSIKGHNNQAMINLDNLEKRIIRSSDLKRVNDAARSIPLSMEEEIVQVIPCEYVVDDQKGIAVPLKMSANRLGVTVHIITASTIQVQNIVRSINQAGFDLEGLIPESLACSYTALSREEKELGVVLINIGEGTTDIITFIDGSPVHNEVIPRGGDELTRRISTVLKTPLGHAEEIKKRYASVFPSSTERDSPIMVTGIGTRPAGNISSSYLNKLVAPEVARLLFQISKRLKNPVYREKIVCGAVITGGGTLLGGILEMAEEVLGMPVKIGLSSNIRADSSIISNPVYTTAFGLIQYGLERRRTEPRWYDKYFWGKITGSIRDFIEEYF